MEPIPSTIDLEIHVVSPSFIPVWNSTLTNHSAPSALVKEFFNHKARFQDSVRLRSDRRKDQDADRFNRDILETRISSGDLVMVYPRTRKLEPRWRGPLRTDEFFISFFIPRHRMLKRLDRSSFSIFPTGSYLLIFFKNYRQV